ncbi:MAG: type IV pilus secretin PilQ [Desulfuromonadales bacterium]
MKWMTKTSMIAAVACAVVIGFSAGMPGWAESAQEITRAKLAAIKSISYSGTGDSAELVIKLSSPATYTSYKTTDPLRLVIDFSQVTQGDINAPVLVNKGNFKTVKVNRYDTDAGVLSRMNIELVHDSEAVVSASPTDPSELRVSFPASAESAAKAVEKTDSVKPVISETAASSPPPASTPAPVSPAPSSQPPTSVPDVAGRTLNSITASNESIILTLDGAVGDFKTFRLNKPERYVVDLINVKSGLAARLIPLNVAGVASARIGLYPDKVRVVFDSVNGDFPEASAAKTDSTVVVTLNVKPIVSNNPNTKLTATRTEAPAEKVSAPVREKPATRAADSDKPLEVAEVQQRSSAKANRSFGPSRVEMIDFQVIEGISRLSVKMRGDVSVDPPVRTAGFVTLTIKNTSLPKSLQRSLDTHSFASPVLRVTPLVVKNKKGTDAKIRIAMRVATSYEFRQEGDMLIVDFKNPEGLTSDKLASETTDRKLSASKAKASASTNADISDELAQPDPAVKSDSLRYKGRKVTLEFADADIRKIFQLLAEVSGKNFILGDDVTGNISLKLVNVPWDQALEIILDTRDLDLREAGNVLTIKKKGSFRTQEAADNENKKIAEKNLPLQPPKIYSVNYAAIDEVAGQFEKLSSGEKGAKIRIDATVTTDKRTNKIIVVDTQDRLTRMQNLLLEIDVPERQVMIEARIIEATSTFTRNLGVNWGIHFRDGSGSMLGINALDTGFGGLTSAPPSTGTGVSPGGSMGISFGTLGSNVQLDMRLNAAASASMIKIISSPKVATLNHKTAKISQGQKIPYQNTTSTAGATTQFIDAALSLDVTPHINANGTIVMQIKATNSSAGSGSPPPINTKEATTEMLLRDGETTVIGGIYVDSDTQGDDGVPYLMDIPLLGKLFKSTDNTKIKTELLIFVTPRILN